ncbi:hypothetical protein EFR00_30945 [Rhizobium sophoriradicis]|nr:hypothetical protein EFR00_30945 [Rhizobium sophoriradicis]
MIAALWAKPPSALRRRWTRRNLRITPDKETGIGSWTREQIVTALQTGQRPDGRLLAHCRVSRAQRPACATNMRRSRY